MDDMALLREYAGVGTISLVVQHYRTLHTAIQIEGNATYSVFQSGSERPSFSVEENFSAIFQGDKWLVNTKLISIKPSAPPQLFCPSYQEAGSDGGDSYFLKYMAKPNETNQDLIGWVEPGSEPNMAQSPSVALIWLACCSGSYLSKSGQNDFKPLWGATSDENAIRQGKCILPVSFRRNPNNPEFLDWLNFRNDGRLDLSKPDRSYLNLYMPPWNNGFNQAVFQVNKRFTYEGRSIPSDFTFEIFAPGISTNSPKLQMTCRLRGTVTNVSTESVPVSWLPKLPKNQSVGVRDYRFTQIVTNWQMVRYKVTNQFYQRTNPIVRRAVRIHEIAAPATSGQ